ncbi:DUF2905 domain-containing protein [Roseiarcus sp.]|uniref:DUF2905 domain-containing protein n=1 Tax=Roseiarcus sp. TaxID=1969460 RepID=UPI003D0FD596
MDSPCLARSSSSVSPSLRSACSGLGFTKLGLGRLPGDIYIQRDNFTFYAPITTGILISLVLSLWSR